jgi:hypothetical protein
MVAQDCADGGVFRTYRIESQNDNRIALEIDLSLFSRALKVSLTPHPTLLDGGGGSLPAPNTTAAQSAP